MSWLYSRALVEGYLGENCLDGEQCALWNATPTQRPSWLPGKTTDACRLSRSGMTYAPLTGERGEELLTWYLEGFRARTSALPGKGKGSPGPGPDCGERCGESLARFDPDTCSWRTHQRLLLGDLEPFLETWPRWGMMRNGECWERMMPALHTGGRGSGFWPTPTKSMVTLGDMEQARYSGNDPRRPSYQKANIPTPSANDWKGSSKAGQRRGQITDPAMGVIQAGGQLNPTWVELLMGWPKNWTCLDNISHVEYLQWLMENCDDEETRGREVLRVLRCGHVAEEVSRSIGRPIGIQQAAVLLADVCQHANRPDQARILMACAETLESDVRGMRTPAQAAGTSHQPGHQGQPTREHPDALQALSRLLAHYGKAAWQDGSWENAVPRVANKVAHRVDRLRCLGNGQVPAVVRLAWETLFSRIG